MGSLFDAVEQDDKMGKENWEEAESAMQEKAARMAMAKAYLTEGKIDYCFAGDLLGQLIATSFGTGSLKDPALRTVRCLRYHGRGIRLGAMTVNAGYGKMYLSWLPVILLQQKKEFRFPCLWKPETKIRHLDGNRLGAAVVGKYGEKESPHRRHHHRPGSRCRNQRFHEYGCSHGPWQPFIQ